MQTVRAIDVGYGNTKFTVGVDAHGAPVCRLFPSFAPLASRRQIGGALMRRRDTVRVRVGEVDYEVGPDARLLMNDHKAHPDHERYVETDEYLALNLGAMAYMDTDVIDILVVGLPVSLLPTHRQALQEQLTGTHALSGERTVTVHKVLVLAQPLGGFINHLRVTHREQISVNHTTLIIDPGYVTLDWLVAQGTKAVESRSGAWRGGMRQILTTLAEAISRDRSLNPTGEQFTNLERIDEGLRCGRLRFGGREVDLATYLPEALAHLGKAINAMTNSIHTANDIDEIVLVGGGSALFQPALQRFMPGHLVHVAEDAVFANVKGFHLAGDFAAQRLTEAVA